MTDPLRRRGTSNIGAAPAGVEVLLFGLFVYLLKNLVI
jgi:hypothetical protein